MPMDNYSCLRLLIAGLAAAMVDIEAHLASFTMEKFLPFRIAKITTLRFINRWLQGFPRLSHGWLTSLLKLWSNSKPHDEPLQLAITDSWWPSGMCKAIKSNISSRHILGHDLGLLTTAGYHPSRLLTQDLLAKKSAWHTASICSHSPIRWFPASKAYEGNHRGIPWVPC